MPEDEFDNCDDCGEEIAGQQVTTPEGQTFHRDCVEITYPGVDNDDTYAEDRLEWYRENGKDPDIEELMEYLVENPTYPKDNAPEVMAEMYGVRSARDLISYSDWVFDRDIKIELKKDMADLFAMMAYFGCALERQYPSYTEKDPSWEPPNKSDTS